MSAQIAIIAGAAAANAPVRVGDPGLLELFFGAAPAELAESQIELHSRKLAEYEALRELDTGEEPRGPWLALESGIGHQREYVRFWERLSKQGRPRGRRRRSSPP